jgi:Icc-related predicted phosphoesterase
MGLLHRTRREDALKIFYAADIHGSDTCWRKFLKTGEFYGVDVIVLGGDLTGKAMVAVVRGPARTWRAQFLGRVAEAHDADELAALEAQLRFNGFYPYRCDPDELERLQADPVSRQARFEEVMREDVRRWMELAAQRLRESPVTCLVMPGNDDGEYIADVLAESAPTGNAEGRLIEVKGMQFLSLGYSNVTPWHTDRELGEDELGERIERLVKELDPAKPAVFNLHVPPYDTRLDDAPELDDSLRFVGGASARMVPVGSHAVRTALEAHQPVLSLHGHIHESRGVARLGRTTAINPGSEYNTGVLLGVIVTLTAEKVVGHQFVAA